MAIATDWAVTGLVPGRELRVLGVAVRDGVVEVRYAVRPGITEAEARGRRGLLPRPVLRVPAPSPGNAVLGGFEPGEAESVGDLELHDPVVRTGEPVTLVLQSPVDAGVTLVLRLGADGTPPP